MFWNKTWLDNSATILIESTPQISLVWVNNFLLEIYNLLSIVVLCRKTHFLITDSPPRYSQAFIYFVMALQGFKTLNLNVL